MVTLKLYLKDGSISGMVIAEIIGWTGCIISSPLSRLDELKKRDELKGSGVYILLSEKKAYIGESECIVKRWRDPKHEIATGEYEKAIVITGKDRNLTKGHIKYLEAKLIDLCDKANRTVLENAIDQQKQLHNLPESDISDMEDFLEKLNIILPAINIEIFKQVGLEKHTGANKSQKTMKKTQSPVFEFKGSGFSATAQIIDDEFTLFRDSKLRKKWEGACKTHGEERKSMIDRGVIKESETELTLTQDYTFPSPSYAASVVCGNENVSGPASWKISGTSKTYKEWIEEKLS